MADPQQMQVDDDDEEYETEEEEDPEIFFHPNIQHLIHQPVHDPFLGEFEPDEVGDDVIGPTQLIEQHRNRLFGLSQLRRKGNVPHVA